MKLYKFIIKKDLQTNLYNIGDIYEAEIESLEKLFGEFKPNTVIWTMFWQDTEDKNIECLGVFSLNQDAITFYKMGYMSCVNISKNWDSYGKIDRD